LYERVFFSPKSKRIDLQLNSKVHAEEQEEFRQKNMEHAIFKNVMKRVPITESMMEFKK